MASTLIDTVSNQLDDARDGDGRESIDNRQRGCGHLRPRSCYIRSDLSALGAPDGEIPPWVTLDDPVEYREHTGRGAIIPGFKAFPGNSFLAHYQADGHTTTPSGDVDDHFDRLRRYGFDGDHYGDITSTRAIDVLMSVGESHWDTPEDYIDETRERGLNLKIPVSNSQDPPVIEPLRTRVFIIHPNGCGDGRPGIIGYAYVTRNVFTTGTEATADDPDIPQWAEDYAEVRDDFDVVDRGEPVDVDEMVDESQTTIGNVVGTDGDGNDVTVEPTSTDADTSEPEGDGETDDRDVATITVTGGDTGDPDVTGLEVEFGRDDLLPGRRARSFDEAMTNGPLEYNILKVIAANRDDVTVGAQPSTDDLITAIVDGADGVVPAYLTPETVGNGGTGEDSA